MLVVSKWLDLTLPDLADGLFLFKQALVQLDGERTARRPGDSRAGCFPVSVV